MLKDSVDDKVLVSAKFDKQRQSDQTLAYVVSYIERAAHFAIPASSRCGMKRYVVEGRVYAIGREFRD